MAKKRPHLYIKNDIKTITRFPKRPMPPKAEEDEKIAIKNYEHKKRTLRSSLQSFETRIVERHQNRTLDIPEHIDYVKIYTHGVFNCSYFDFCWSGEVEN
jgi:hypothetical protein